MSTQNFPVGVLSSLSLGWPIRKSDQILFISAGYNFSTSKRATKTACTISQGAKIEDVINAFSCYDPFAELILVKKQQATRHSQGETTHTRNTSTSSESTSEFELAKGITIVVRFEQ